MDQDFENKTCYKHINQKILTVDLKRSKQDESRYLCLKCLIDLIDNQNITEVKETKEMIKDIKNKQKEQKIQNLEKTISCLQSAQQNLYQFKEAINKLLGTILDSILNKIQDISQQLEQIKQQEVLINYSKDLNTLSENYKGFYDYDIPLENDENNREKEFINKIQSSLLELAQHQNLLGTLKDMDKLKSFQILPIKKSWTKLQETNKTPSLRINCNQHGKEVIMFNICQDQEQINRLACVDCIQQNPTHYITLEQANIKWNEIKGKQYEIMIQYTEKRAQKKKNFIKQLEINCNEYLENATKIIQSFQEQTLFLESQSQKIQEFNNQHLNELDYKHLQDVIEILTKNNSLIVINQQQLKQEQYDQRYYDDAIKSFLKLISFNKTNVQNMLLINNQIMQDEEVPLPQNNLNKNNKNIQQEYLEIINKLDLFQMELQIFQNITQSYQIIDKQAEQMKSLLKAQLNEQPEKQLQQKFEFFDQLHQSFLENTEILKKFFSIEKLEQRNLSGEQKIQELDNKLKQKILLFDKLNQQKEELNNQLQIQNNQIEQLSKKQIISLDQQKQQNLDEINRQKVEIENYKQISAQNLKIRDEEINTLKQWKQQLEQNPLYSAFQQEERTVTEMNQYARELEFCSFNKHQHLKVPENERKKIKTETGNSGWYFGICNKRIPDKRVTKVCFKVTGQEKEAFILGIGSKDIMRQNNFYDCQKQGRGTYILMNYEGFFNHQGQKREAFKFWPNDVIMIEVDMNLKFIRWTKKDTRDGFATKLVLEGELYFCVGLWYRDQSIQILNDFF